MMRRGDNYSTFSIRDGYGLLTINRKGDTANLVDDKMVDSLERRLEQIQDSIHRQEIFCLVVTVAEGDARGVDLNFMHRLEDNDARSAFATRVRNLYQDYAELSVVSVLVISPNQAFVGGGFELALVWDYRVGMPGCTFQLSEVKLLGILPGFGGTQRLPRLIGSWKAAEAILCGTVFGSRSALEVGILDYASEESDADVVSVACNFVAGKSKRPVIAADNDWTGDDELIKNLYGLKPTYPQDVVGAALGAVLSGSSLYHLRAGLEVEAKLFSRCLDGPAAQEGLRAALEGRVPSWVAEDRELCRLRQEARKAALNSGGAQA